MVVQPVDGIVVARSLEGISQRRRDPELEQIVSDQLSRVEQESIESQDAPAPMIASVPATRQPAVGKIVSCGNRYWIDAVHGKDFCSRVQVQEVLHREGMRSGITRVVQVIRPFAPILPAKPFTLSLQIQV